MYSLIGTAQSGAEFSESTLNKIANSSTWRSLLHLNDKAPKKSNIYDSSFFLTSSNPLDPLAELKETLNAFSKPIKNANKHGLCRYPARRIFLERQLKITFKEIDCPARNDWIKEKNIESISLVFASGNFKTPASFFGHSFIKLNTDNNQDYLFDPVVNFGIQIPDSDPTLVFLFKSFIGSYDAQFTQGPFHKVLGQYGEQDLRDIWEYRLNLTPFQKTLLIEHLWELNGVNFQYFFLKGNCAYYLAAAFDPALGWQIFNSRKPWAMPLEIFQKVKTAANHDAPLSDGEQLFLSRRREFQERFFASDTALKSLIKAHIAAPDENFYKSEAYFNLTHSDKFSLLDTLIDFYEYQYQSTKNKEFVKIKQSLLLERLALGTGKKSTVDFITQNPPHLAQKSSMIALKTNHTLSESNASIVFRPAYFDFLNLPAGRNPFSSFKVLETELQITEEASLRSLTLFEIYNINASKTGIKEDSGRSWHFGLGIEDLNQKCSTCNRSIVDIQLGTAKRLNPSTATSWLFGARLQENRFGAGFGGVQSNLGITSHIGDFVRIHGRFGFYETFNKNQLYDQNHVVEASFGSSQDWQFRIKYEKKISETWSILLSRFF